MYCQVSKDIIKQTEAQSRRHRYNQGTTAYQLHIGISGRYKYHHSMDCQTVSKSLGYLTSISPSWLSSCTNSLSPLKCSFRISTELVVSFSFRNSGFTFTDSSSAPLLSTLEDSSLRISPNPKPFSALMLMLPSLSWPAPARSVELKRLSSSSMLTLVDWATWLSTRSLLILARYSSKEISSSSVSSSMESMKVSVSFAFSFFSTSFSVLLMLISLSTSSWFLITCAEVSPMMFVYYFHVLKMATRSRTFFLRLSSFASGVESLSSISLSRCSDLAFSLAMNSWSWAWVSCLLELRRSTSKLCLWTSSLTSLRLQAVIWLRSSRQRGMRILFFSLMISSLLVTRCTSWKLPNSQARASAKSLQQYSVEAMYSGKMVSSLRRESTFSSLNQYWLLSCSMILRMRLRLILRTSSSCRCLLSRDEYSSSLALHLAWFSCTLKALVNTCFRKLHWCSKCLCLIHSWCLARYSSSILF